MDINKAMTEAEEKLKIFHSIKSLFDEDNDSILYGLFKKGIKTISTEELYQCGFNGRCLIKSDTRIHDPLFGRVILHNSFHFTGFDLVKNCNNTFSIIETNNTAKEAKKLNTIRDLELKIEGLGNQLFAYRFEFDNPVMAEKIEKDMNDLEEQLESLKSN